MYGYTVHFLADDNSEDQASRLKALYRKRRFTRTARRPLEAHPQRAGLSRRRFEHRELGAPPGWRVHQLAGDRAGTWSISVSGNWRITFGIERGEITNLDLEDYH
jgi:plasmid maintenance system killer protein